VQVKITFERLAVGMTLKVTQGHRNCLYSIGHISLPTTTTTLFGTIYEILPHSVYMTGCDLQKSYVLKKTVEITSHVCILIHV